jgi:hypothetical protein
MHGFLFVSALFLLSGFTSVVQDYTRMLNNTDRKAVLCSSFSIFFLFIDAPHTVGVTWTEILPKLENYNYPPARYSKYMNHCFHKWVIIHLYQYLKVVIKINVRNITEISLVPTMFLLLEVMPAYWYYVRWKLLPPRIWHNVIWQTRYQYLMWTCCLHL